MTTYNTLQLTIAITGTLIWLHYSGFSFTKFLDKLLTPRVNIVELPVCIYIELDADEDQESITDLKAG